MRLFTPLFAAALLLGLCAASAQADDSDSPARKERPRAARGPAQGLHQFIQRADQDGDGALSRQEIQRALRAVKTRGGRGPGADKDAAARRERPEAGRRMGRQGRRDRQAAPARAPRLAMLFRRLDRDGSGALSLREFAAGMMRAHTARHGQDTGMRGRGTGMRGRRMGMQGHGTGMRGRGMGMQGHGTGMRGRGMGMQGHGTGMRGRGMGMQGHGTGMRGRGMGMQGHGTGMRGRGTGMAGRAAGRQARGPMAARRQGPPDRAQARRRAQAQGSAIFARLRAADRNGDGQLSKGEAPPLLKEHFATLDKDGDGVLSRAEIRQGVARLQRGTHHDGARPAEKQKSQRKDRADPSRRKAKSRKREKSRRERDDL